MTCRLCGSSEGTTTPAYFRCECGAITWLTPERRKSHAEVMAELSKPRWGVGSHQDREHR